MEHHETRKSLKAIQSNKSHKKLEKYKNYSHKFNHFHRKESFSDLNTSIAEQFSTSNINEEITKTLNASVMLVSTSFENVTNSDNNYLDRWKRKSKESIQNELGNYNLTTIVPYNSLLIGNMYNSSNINLTENATDLETKLKNTYINEKNSIIHDFDKIFNKTKNQTSFSFEKYLILIFYVIIIICLTLVALNISRKKIIFGKKSIYWITKSQKTASRAEAII